MKEDHVINLIERATKYEFVRMMGRYVAHTDRQLKQHPLGVLTISLELNSNFVTVGVRDASHVDFEVSVPVYYDPNLPARFMTQVHRVLVLAAELVTYQEKP